jgi:DNA invertase Pin-like site-specific DNA recombinase
MKVAIYARVSTTDQNYEGQLEELNALAERSGWEVVQIYSEKISGTKATEDRPELKRMMRDARLRKFEKVVVWSVDRLGRSMKNLILVLTELKDSKIDIFSYKQAIDTSTAMGSMFFQFLGIFSEFENTIRKERQIVGIRKAKERGVRFGRKPTTEAQIAARTRSTLSIELHCQLALITNVVVSGASYSEVGVYLKKVSDHSCD